ncbi:hypothetical protein Hanom_Chr11g00995181 [Helianthus anomalus]
MLFLYVYLTKTHIINAILYVYYIAIYINTKKNLKSCYFPDMEAPNQIATHKRFATLFTIALAMSAINSYC